MRISNILAIQLSSLFLSVLIPANAFPGYHIDSDKSAKQAVQQYAENNFQFDAVVYQAYLDKNLWRLAMVAHNYLGEKPRDPVTGSPSNLAFPKMYHPLRPSCCKAGLRRRSGIRKMRRRKCQTLSMPTLLMDTTYSTML